MDRHPAVLVSAVLLSLSGIGLDASAQELQPVEESPGYVFGNSGLPARDNSGNCVRTSLWTPELAIAACDPDLVQRPEEVAVAEPEPAEPAAPIAAFETVTLETITLFDFDKAQLRDTGRKKLDRLIARMGDNETAGAVEVAGHADATGPEEYNKELSERRAESVREYLVQNGIDPNRVEIRAMGETQPIASNETREGRQLNRRVEIQAPVQRPAEQ